MKKLLYTSKMQVITVLQLLLEELIDLEDTLLTEQAAIVESYGERDYPERYYDLITEISQAKTSLKLLDSLFDTSSRILDEIKGKLVKS